MIEYKYFVEKLKPNFKKDLETHPEKDSLQGIISTLFRYHETFLNIEPKESLGLQSCNYVNYLEYIKHLKEGKYLYAYNFLAGEPMTGGFDYAIIKKSEEILFDD